MTTTFATETAVSSPTATPDRSRSAAARTARTPFWDNARFIAVALVVAGHAILELISKSDPAYSIYLFVYLFHLPVLVAISGHFAKASLPTVSDVRKLLRTLVVPYLIFETIWTGIHWAISGTLKLDYTTAWWTLWFLMALVIWRVLLPYLVVFRFPLALSIVLSVGAGYLSSVDDRLALARTLGLLPFFVLGWKIRQWGIAERWLALRSSVVWRWRAAAIAVFAVVAIVTAVGIDTWRDLLIRRFLLYDEQYSSFGYEQWWAGAGRLVFMGIGMVLCFAFLILMPRRETVLTAIGQATLYVYLLHSFALYPIRQWSWFQGNTAAWVLVAAIAFSLLLPFALGNHVTRRVFRPLVEPRLDWLFRGGDAGKTLAAAEGAAQTRSPLSVTTRRSWPRRAYDRQDDIHARAGASADG